jgi:hypothetical protein
MRFTFRLTEFLRVIIATVLSGSPAWSADARALPRDADERVFVYGGTYFNSFNSNFTYVGSNIAPWGLDRSGMRFGMFGGGGSYEYLPTTGTKSSGKFISTDALVGWSLATGIAHTNFMVGANYQDQKLDRPDPTNPVQGAKLGFKGQVDTYVNPTPSTMIFALGAYSTAFRTYYTEAKLGVALLHDVDVFIGPQFTALGNLRFDEWRIGGHLTGMRLGLIEISLAGGYLRDSNLGSGVYGTVNASIRF